MIDNGNISTKTNMGLYSYNDANKPHAVDYIEACSEVQDDYQYIDYNAWNKVEEIYYSDGDDGYTYEIEYGPDGQRVMSRMYKNGSLYCRKFYWGEYEEIHFYSNSETVRTYWVEAPDGLAGMFWTSTSDYYTVVHPNVAITDHLGSLTGLYDYDGNKVFDASYDAWGKRTLSPNSFTFIARGYTGHEHLDELGLINMNGRMYDPRQGRFLSPDPFVQAPSNPQNYNRYSYCLNNPLKYTDPSGEIIWAPILFAAAMGGVQGTMLGLQNGAEGWDLVGYIAGGAALGALSGGLAQGMAAIGASPFVSQLTCNAVTSSLGAGMMSHWDVNSMLMGLGSGLLSGCVSGAINLSYDPVGMINGMLADGAVNAATGALTGGLTEAIFGNPDNIGKAALNGAIMGGISGMATGALRGMKNAETLGVNHWTGGTLEERAQAWANYYGLPGDMYHYASRDNLKALCRGKYFEYVRQYDGIAKIRRSDNELLAYKIRGITSTDGKNIYMSGKAIRHARFNTGWAKGVFFHERYHSLNDDNYGNEFGAHIIGYEYGGRSYYRHFKEEMEKRGIPR